VYMFHIKYTNESCGYITVDLLTKCLPTLLCLVAWRHMCDWQCNESSVRVLQDLLVGSFVMWVQFAVTDTNSTVHYKLVTSPSVMTGFSINRQSGVVSTTAALDPTTTYTVSL